MACRTSSQFQDALKPALACLGFLFSVSASADIFHGVDFPGGAASFADSVFSYDPAFGGEPYRRPPSEMRLKRWARQTFRKVQTRNMSVWVLEGGLS